MSDKPRKAAGYSRDTTQACETLLVILLGAFGELAASLRLIGGLVPLYLAPEAPPDVPAPVGTNQRAGHRLSGLGRSQRGMGQAGDAARCAALTAGAWSGDPPGNGLASFRGGAWHRSDMVPPSRLRFVQ